MGPLTLTLTLTAFAFQWAHSLIKHSAAYEKARSVLAHTLEHAPGLPDKSSPRLLWLLPGLSRGSVPKRWTLGDKKRLEWKGCPFFLRLVFKKGRMERLAPSRETLASRPSRIQDNSTLMEYVVLEGDASNAIEYVHMNL